MLLLRCASEEWVDDVNYLVKDLAQAQAFMDELTGIHITPRLNVRTGVLAQWITPAKMVWWLEPTVTL